MQRQEQQQQEQIRMPPRVLQQQQRRSRRHLQLRPRRCWRAACQRMKMICWVSGAVLSDAFGC
jgi:hypothetical protein